MPTALRIRYRRSLLTALVLAVLLTPAFRPLAAYADDTAQRYVAVGGVAGFADLADELNSRQLRATGNVRLYIHVYSWIRTPPAEQKKVLSVFKNSGEPIIEINISSKPKSYFKEDFLRSFIKSGVRCDYANVNGLNADKPIANWMSFVDAGRTAGLSVLAPVVTPNSGQFRQGPFMDSRWDNIRAAALYGKGLTIDAPVDFFFTQPAAYRQFVIDELSWANANALRTAVILSPGNSASLFLNDTKRLLDTLSRAKALPNDYIVENYDPNPTPGYMNRVGTELATGSVTSVALWVAKMRRVLPVAN